MSRKFSAVKKYYDDGLWSKAAVHNAVTKGWITDKEYELIAGEAFIK